jgi:hypothetical protein
VLSDCVNVCTCKGKLCVCLEGNLREKSEAGFYRVLRAAQKTFGLISKVSGSH